VKKKGISSVPLRDLEWIRKG